MDNLPSDPPEPFSQPELAALREAAARGHLPDLATIRRYIATIRKNVSSIPAKTESLKKSRTKAPPPDEASITFF